MSTATKTPIIRMPSELIEKAFNIVEGDKRMSFIPEQFGGGGTGLNIGGEFERNAYTIAREQTADYEAGAWVFAETADKSSFFIYPLRDEDALYQVRNEDDEYFQIDAITFGLMVSIRALEKGTERHVSEQSTAVMYDAKVEALATAFSEALSETVWPDLTDDELKQYAMLNDAVFMLSDL